jgi:hypothetical protein
METLGVKRAHLQRAFSACRLASERGESSAADSAPVDVSGRPDAAKARWFEYLDAKQRLTSAHAGQRGAA